MADLLSQLRALMQAPDTVNSLEFNAWNKDQPELVQCARQMFEETGVLRELNISLDHLLQFVGATKNSYNDNPFHNFWHAVTVAQMAYLFITKTELAERLNPKEKFAVIVAALCHDLDHPGLSNGYQINSKSPLAVMYNNQSVLENHHLATCLKLLKSADDSRGSFAAMRAAMPDVQAMDFAVAARLEEEMKAGARAEPELEPVPESPAAAQELPLVHAPKEPEPEPEPEPEKKHKAESEPAMEMSSEPEGPASLPPQIVEHALAHEPAVEQLHPQQLQPEKDEVETAHQKLEEETPAPAPAAAATTSPTAASASAATVPAATTDHPSSEAGESSTNSLETASDGGSVSVPTPPPSEGADEDDEDAEQGEEEPADSAAVVIVAPPVVDVVEIDEEEEADGEPDGEPEGEKKIESESGDGVVAEGEEKGEEKETKTE